ncbi:hypothetical protein C8J55DRAFT_516939 [Lentinula edodes]|uniref:Uncharacterized protein n=1 Tax=Lentinula lateritia TaxID=40482 RepID=A0A9W9DLS7_9AGAR|nr:hypothetical protein C8J55DRAFT_516939 [Lentinula edodes]
MRYIQLIKIRRSGFFWFCFLPVSTIFISPIIRRGTLSNELGIQDHWRECLGRINGLQYVTILMLSLSFFFLSTLFDHSSPYRIMTPTNCQGRRIASSEHTRTRHWA